MQEVLDQGQRVNSAMVTANPVRGAQVRQGQSFKVGTEVKRSNSENMIEGTD